MKTVTVDGLRLYQFTQLSRENSISHFVSTIHGGVSQGSYKSLNLGAYCEDDPVAVRTNRQRLANGLSIDVEKLVVPYQVHGVNMLKIDSSFLSLSAEEQNRQLYGVDALITNQPEICIAVSTADCVPLLLYSPEKQVVAAVHAGWRGTVGQIAQKVVLQLKKQFGCDPQTLFAGIGPSICQHHFEVGEEVVDAFVAARQDMQSILSRHPKTQKAHIDLWKANRLQLEEAGVPFKQIEMACLCTVCQQEDFFSARRSGLLSGRMLSGIWMK
ncbi:peptidoglycan editing factor PgeF [Parabacteroides sp. PF5-9]|uniref:peptidoglycan editing factor PgeF n=1 Tax=Parabacteroides sp. PF5-9 TaxID=1742404 RepID=UPI0024733DB0|nr:peptidoglycan editing factor PgeF [Parabacteroides sp. PF5-9]MDH6356226.1 YfiH family protein [Parabacteroides sp. PF5-9]